MQDEELWTFARFTPGNVFGSVDVTMDDVKRQDWEAIYGRREDDMLPRGMLVVAMMEAYVRAIQPRPKGNVHASQMLDFRDVRPQWGDTVKITVSCADKQEKKGRFWVDFGVRACVGDKEVLAGTITSIWAA